MRVSAAQAAIGVDAVVLGALAVEFGVGANLRRLEHDHHQAVAAQLLDYRLLVAAAGFDPDPTDSVPTQPRGQPTMT
jgi:hypothetical protein